MGSTHPNETDITLSSGTGGYPLSSQNLHLSQNKWFNPPPHRICQNGSISIHSPAPSWLKIASFAGDSKREFHRNPGMLKSRCPRTLVLTQHSAKFIKIIQLSVSDCYFSTFFTLFMMYLNLHT